MKHRISFQTKLAISYLLFLFVFILFSTIYWIVQLRIEQRTSIDNQLSLLAKQGSSEIDTILQQAKPALYLHTSNELLVSVLDRSNGNVISSADIENLKYFERGVLQQNENLISIIFIDTEGVAYTVNSEPDLIKNIDRYLEAIKNSHGLPYIAEPFYGVVGQELFYILPICKELVNLNTGRVVGYTIIYLDFSSIYSKIDDPSSLNGGYYTLLLDGTGNTLYSSNVNHNLLAQFKYGLTLSDLEKFEDEGSQYYDYKDGTVRIFGLKNSITGWIVLKFCSSNYHSSALTLRIIIFFSISFAGFLLLALIAYFVSKRFSSNINLLHNAFITNKGVKLVPVNEEFIQNDDIGDLVHSFNKMVNLLNDSIEKQCTATIRFQEMHIKMLNYQINPHFLYNCLNLISSLAIINNVPEINKISHILGDMFRYSIENKDVVKIRDELNHITDYLKIQETRYPDRFHVNYDIDPILLDIPCLKFILQPIVENCFSHAFPLIQANEPFEILIKINRKGKDIILSVTDNGIGIKESDLEKIRSNLYLDENLISSNQSSIGLWNIHRRVESYYGKPYGVFVDSEFGQSTTVYVLFSLPEES